VKRAKAFESLAAAPQAMSIRLELVDERKSGFDPLDD
jgi:hypothetical protein